jgi:teichoic acid transport system permease protein
MNSVRTSPTGIACGELRDADHSINLRSYLSELWSRRDYVKYVSQSNLRSQQMSTILGNVWHLLNPALQIAVFYLIFGVILGVDRGVDNLLAFISVGLFAYQFSTKSITSGSRAIVANRPLLRSIWFPRAMLPVTSSVTEFFAFVPVLFVMAAVCLGTGEGPRITWLAVPLIVAMQWTFNLGLAMAMARVANHVVDVQQFLPYIFRLMLYGSGVLFLIDEYVENSSYQLLFELNPFYGFVSMWRWAVLSYPIDAAIVWLTSITTIVALTAGFWYFRSGERGYTDGT